MRTLSIDPGVTTGVALLSEDGEILESHAIGAGSGLRSYLTRKASEGDLEVVAESGPQWSVHHKVSIREVEEMIEEIFSEGTWVQPSQWKGHPASSRLVPVGISQHERDAIRLGYWFQAMRRRGVRI